MKFLNKVNCELETHFPDNKNICIKHKLLKLNDNLSYVLSRLHFICNPKSTVDQNWFYIKTDINTLSSELGMTDRTVRRTLVKLKDNNIIKKHSEGYAFSQNVHREIKEYKNTRTVNTSLVRLFGGSVSKALLLRYLIQGCDNTTNKYGYFYKSYAQIYDDLGIKETTTWRILNEFKELGLIEHTVKFCGKSGNRKHTNHFRIKEDNVLMFIQNVKVTETEDVLYTWKSKITNNSYVGIPVKLSNKHYYQAKYRLYNRGVINIAHDERRLFEYGETLNIKKAPESMEGDIFLLAI
jgi:DNA-binding Lrp family transcriptional regulator